MEQVSLGNHPAPPEGCPDVIKCLMLSCWTRWAKERIEFSEIVKKLSKDNIKVSMTHSNPCYGMTTCQEPIKPLDDPASKVNAPAMGVKKKSSFMITTETEEKPKSWPKLSNFAEISTSLDISHTQKESACEESDDSKSLPSIKPSTEYTVIISDN